MKTCKNCIYYDPFPKHPWGGIWGTCSHEDVNDYIAFRWLPYEDYSDDELIFNGNFGCRFFKSKLEEGREGDK